ncbi:conserved hypothetical protein [Ricinus communis]|uniref:Uncharacterized protein n=1 Tax=Ricinus communis TaxID=3988 RepID=B9S7F6_RICCO|nr:conserved hypothetical protein [Ricinus communis]
MWMDNLVVNDDSITLVDPEGAVIRSPELEILDFQVAKGISPTLSTQYAVQSLEYATASSLAIEPSERRIIRAEVQKVAIIKG